MAAENILPILKECGSIEEVCMKVKYC